MDFVSFHSHTTFSYSDGFGTVRDHVKRVSGLGMSALALSEHGNLNSHPALEKECKRVGIKPIFGCEVYFAPSGERSKTHLTIFAMNEEGYRNLNRIVTQSYLDFYQYPTVTWDNLKEHNAGIVVLSGCSDSLISCTLMGGKFLGDRRTSPPNETDKRLAYRRIQRFQNVFGGRFYLEVQRFPKLDRTCALNSTLADLSQSTGVPLIATADVHYPFPSDNQMQKVLHAARRGSSVAVTEAEWEYKVLLTYPESDMEIFNDLTATGLSELDAMRAIANTGALAELCTVELPKARPLRFTVPDGFAKRSQPTLTYARQQIMDGWRERIAQRPELTKRVDEYQKRISQEFKVIREKGFVDYFLATADLVSWSKGQDITVGPARGSAAASLVCYLLGITEIDPLHPAFDRMVFERFLDPTRNDPPDIDLDLDDELRYRTGERAREIYGQENVANVGNHIRYRGRRALDDVARAYGLGQRTFEPIKRRIADRTETDERVDDSIADVLESYKAEPEISALVAAHSDKLAQAVRLEGNQHSMGIHAGGYVISSDPIPDVCAIYTREKSGGRSGGRNREVAQVIPYEKRDAEYLNFLKMDFLSSKTMGMLGLCRQWTGVTLEVLYPLFYRAWDEPDNDLILKAFRDDDVTGVMQYEGGTTRSLLRRVKPATFDELAAVGALSRPGPYYGGQADAYIAVKNGEMDWERIHPGFDEHVEWTHGQIVYQEQIMRILRDLAGFDIATVLRVRKIIGKKLGEHQFTTLWDQFRCGVRDTSGVSEDVAMRVWGAITTAAGYAFNIAHAYSYALVAWWQMYFKINYPNIFFAASLAKNGDDKDSIPRRTALLQDAVVHGISMAPFDGMASKVNWIPLANKSIRPGFLQIDGIGPATAEDMAAWREDTQGNVVWDDYIEVHGIGKLTVEKTKAFVSQEDPFGIHKTQKQLDEFRKQLENGEFDEERLPSPEEYFRSDELPEQDHVAFVGLVANTVYRDEIETIRSRTGKTAEEIRAGLDDPDKTKKATVFAYDENGEVALRVSRWRYPYLQGRIGALKPDYHIVVAFGRTFEGKTNSIQVKTIWVLDPD